MLSISNVSVSATAPAGTAVGVLTLFDSTMTSRQANFILTDDAAGFFGMTGTSLVTQQPSLPKGYYAVKVKATSKVATLNGTGHFMITIS
jgi:hypothetical protein